jgi:uncharacterized coiled-coil DUF342 family protein
MSKELTKPTKGSIEDFIDSDITADVKVGMNEVVNVFVSQYEDNLHVEKTRLSKALKELKSRDKQLDKDIENSALANRSDYEMLNTIVGIQSELKEVELFWDKKTASSYRYNCSLKSLPQSFIELNVEVSDTDKNGSSFSKYFFGDISKADVDLHNEIAEGIKTTSGDLQDVLSNIKAVSRKERQIRGKISKMKLEASGYEGLLESPEMAKLIQIDS